MKDRTHLPYHFDLRIEDVARKPLGRYFVSKRPTRFRMFIEDLHRVSMAQ
jgi:hypothetical protein